MPIPFRDAAVTITLAVAPWFAPAAQQMTVEEYEPRSSLVVPAHPRPRAKYPFVDVHSHQWTASPTRADSLVRAMDAMNMAVMVNLSGRSGPQLVRGLEAFAKHRTRFVVFANVDFSGINDPEFGRIAAEQLARDYQAGARGLKIFKNLGMEVRFRDGRRVPVDDPRLDPLWAKAGELGIPVLIHTADPHQFWQPMDRFNERWYELKEVPGRIRPPDRYPPWETIMAEQWNIIRRHPKTTFISAHLSWLGGDLARLGRLMDSMPNLYTEIGAVLAELGRQPRFAREWFLKYQDRVLFGKDAWEPTEYPYYFRTLETADEYFDYYRRRHAFWKLYGLDLPDEVLKKLYYKNALRIIPGIDKRLFPE
jgi:predicted TIM-barrel fold metal-dependent hydrolase